MDAAEIEVVDVSRDGRWCQVLLGSAAPVAQVENGPFVGVVSADLGSESIALLTELRPELQEIVCFDSIAEPGATGQDFAMSALEQGGFGQDFVFTVPVLEQALEYALQTMLREDHGGWEGRCVVVLGPAPVLQRAERHLSGPRPV